MKINFLQQNVGYIFLKAILFQKQLYFIFGNNKCHRWGNEVFFNLFVCKAIIYSFVGAASLTGHAASAVEGRKADAVADHVEDLEADAVATVMEGLDANAVATAPEGCEVVCTASSVEHYDFDFGEGS